MFFFPALAINIDLIVFGFDTIDFFKFFLSTADALPPFPTGKKKKLKFVISSSKSQIFEASVISRNTAEVTHFFHL